MTREEEIKKEAMRNPLLGLGTFQKAFIRGTEWADRTMIENTCKWLTRELCYTARGSNFFNNKTATDEFVEQFKQAMKGSNQ